MTLHEWYVVFRRVEAKQYLYLNSTSVPFKKIQTRVLRRIQATQLNIYLDDDADFALLQARIARNAAAKPHRFSEAKPLSLRCGQNVGEQKLQYMW